MNRTMLEDFKRKYPNAPLTDNGTPEVCPHYLGFPEKEEYCVFNAGAGCVECWNRPAKKKRKWRIRKNSPLDWALTILAVIALIMAINLPSTLSNFIGG